MSSTRIADQVLKRLQEAIGSQSLERTDREIENLADVIVGALLFGNHAVIVGLYPAVERLYAHFRAGDQASGLMAGQLRALTTVLMVAALRRRIDNHLEIARKHRDLLTVLLKANTALTNQELAQRLRLCEETIARKLPELRSAGLVTTTRVWKSRLNKLSERGVDAIRAVLAEGRQTMLADTKNSSVHFVLAEGRQAMPVDAENDSLLLKDPTLGRRAMLADGQNESLLLKDPAFLQQCLEYFLADHTQVPETQISDLIVNTLELVATAEGRSTGAIIHNPDFPRHRSSTEQQRPHH